MKNYLRCIASVDDNVGRVIDYLDEAGLRENTIVMYTSDQGFFLGDHSTPAYVAYPGQPQVLMLRDADLDKSPKAESLTLVVTSRYKVEATEAAEAEAAGAEAAGAEAAGAEAAAET